MDKTVIGLLSGLAAVACGAAGLNDLELPPCGILVGNAIYNNQGLYPGGYCCWNVQRASPFELIERTVREEQGNLVQFWWFGPRKRPLMQANWLDLGEVGFRCPEPDWKNLRYLRLDEFPEFAKYEKERAGAGVLKALQLCESNGLYSTMIYLDKANEKYTRRFTENPHYIGFDFGERFSFRPTDASAMRETKPRLDELAADLIRKVSAYNDECRKKGYGNIICTSSNFYMDYEVAAGVDMTMFEDFTSDLSIPSALSRGLVRQYGRKLWGSHIANEYYSWISSKNPHFYEQLYAAMAMKYLAGAKVIISESGAWHCQMPGCDSPLGAMPKTKGGYSEPETPDEKLGAIAEAAEKVRDTASEEGFWSRSFRAQMAKFYRYVKEHGTPEGQPESPFAIAKGNLDLYCGEHDGRPKHTQTIGGMDAYSERHLEWLVGAPEYGWGIAADVFWPHGRGIYGTKDGNRFFSGTPWGQVDVVSFACDQPSADFLLKNYRSLAFVGWNTCSEKQYGTLCDYVKGGGRLFISIPQLSTDVTRNFMAYTVDDLVRKGDFTELCGVKVKGRKPRMYWVDPAEDGKGGRTPWVSAATHGAYRLVMGDVEVSNARAEKLMTNWESGDTVLYRLPSGKGEVWFLNSWYYPGAYNHSYGEGNPDDSTGFVGDVLKELARLSRGHAWITERGEKDPGGECAYVNFSYFPSTKEVLLFNVDFERTHRVDLHFGGKVLPLDLKPQEIVRFGSKE